MNLIPFTIHIKNYDESSFTFYVEYIPKDETLPPISINVRLNPDEVKSEAHALDMLKKSCPHLYWQDLIKSKETDHSAFASLKGKKEEVKSEYEDVSIQPQSASNMIDDVVNFEEAKLQARIEAILYNIKETTV